MTAHPPEPAGRVRVGVLLSSLVVPAWVDAAIRDIVASGDAELVAVGITDGPLPESTGSASSGGRRLPIRRVLRRIDRMLDRPIPADQDAFATKDARPLFADVPVLAMRWANHIARTFAEEDLAGLRSGELDVLLWLGDGGRPRGDVLRIARAGLWSFHVGDTRNRRGAPAGFWEVHDRRPVTDATLEILADDPRRNQTLGQTSTATVSTSIMRTRNAVLWSALPILGRALRDLRRQGVDVFLEHVAEDNAPPSFDSNPRYRSPGLSDLVVHGARRAARLAGIVATRPFSRQQWVLYYGLADDLIEDCWRLQPLAPPVDRFWADPHVVMVGEGYFVFVEELPYATGKGHISVIEIDRDGRASPARKVLEEAHHLSYPLVFEHEGEHFMVPESAARGTIDLYRATSFPDRWELVEHLMTGIEAYDATLLREHDRWWLFASVIKYHGAGSGELVLYSSDRLIGGDWRLHPASPLWSDVTGARPAGAILRRHGRLYRPAQDGSGLYGRAIKLNEILELTEDRYREELVSRIEPTWNRRIRRTHTLAHAGRLTVVDALWRRGRWPISPPSRAEDRAPADDQARPSFTAST